MANVNKKRAQMKKNTVAALPPWRLVTEILALSVANTWAEAKKEWDLKLPFFADSQAPRTCLCGHSPIIECCVLRNRENGEVAVVGNVCVRRFMDLPSNGLFKTFGRIRANHAAALNAEAGDFVYGQGWIKSWEHQFYVDTMRQRTLSFRQMAKRQQINAKILKALSDSSPEAEHA